jgi:hypothetical protein
MTKRSPNYPAIGLEEAIKKTKAIYEQEHDNPTDKAVMAKHLGYNGLNGASLTTISALTKYGLLEAVGPKQLKVSAFGRDLIWLEKGNPERVKLLKEAAFAPSLFSDLRDAFPEKPPSDQSLRHHLIRKDFNPNAVDSAIRAYRDTLDFVNAEEEALVSSASDGSEQPSEELMPTQPNQPSRDTNPSYSNTTNGTYAPTEQNSSEETLQFRISEDCVVRMQFNGSVTQEGIEKLVALLKLNADVYPTKESQKSSTESWSEKLPLQQDFWQPTLAMDGVES